MLVGARLTTGARPVPETRTFCGLPAALSVTVTFAVRAPITVGTNTTLIVQFAPAATDVPQLLVCVKSAAFGCVIVMVPIFNVALPVLVSVNAIGALACPTTVLGKVRLVGEKLTTACPKACAAKANIKTVNVESSSPDRNFIPSSKNHRGRAVCPGPCSN